MDNSEAVMIEGENYEVVDECTGEEDSSSSVQVVPGGNAVTVPEAMVVDVEPVVPKPETEGSNESTAAAAAADVTLNNNLEQSEEQREVTDEDVISHLEEIENIVLEDMNTFLESTEADQQANDSSLLELEIKDDTDNKLVLGSSLEESTTSVPCLDSDKTQLEPKPRVEWYEKKLAEKEAIVRERMKKLAKVLAFSYPCYEKWLAHVEKKYGSSVCYLQSVQQCSLDKPYTNRWKFICIKKTVQVSSQKADNGDTSHNKSVERVWHLEATAAWGVNTSNESDFPPFVLRAVKVFKDFLETTGETSVGSEIDPVKENFSDDISMDAEPKKEPPNEGRPQWLWLLVRCNSMDELMLFATGRNIDRATMDRLKQVYETGPGKDCNVKSLYCKSSNKCDDTTVTNTTFLVGSEALDEVVGGIKVQLAPKTNFWSNAAGAENVANTVTQLLAPTRGVTVLDVGCGIGLIGLMMADKCQHVIGVDSPSEVEEAEMTCELNNIKNASFIMGTPADVPTKIVNLVKNRGTYAVINANTNIGRATEVMICLRKMLTVQRIAMITTLTKHSVRAILELVRPDRNNGGPFRPIIAATVDTLPIGPHFEVVILLERGNPNKLMQSPAKFFKYIGAKLNSKGLVPSPDNTTAQDPDPVEKVPVPQATKKPAEGVVAPAAKKAKVANIKKPAPAKAAENAAKNKQKGKRTLSPEKSAGPPKKLKKFETFGNKVWRADMAGKKKKDRRNDPPHLRVNPLYEKKLRDKKEADLRQRLSTNRVDSDIAQKLKEHQALLGIATEKLSGTTPTVDISTAKQLQNMLKLVLEQTNRLQNQLPRSVWDRIAPPETITQSTSAVGGSDIHQKSRFVQETGDQDIVITTQNQNFVNEGPVKKPYAKRNIMPLEPDMMPVGPALPIRERRSSPDRYGDTNFGGDQAQGNLWTRERPFERNRWNNEAFNRRQTSPTQREFSPERYHNSSPRRFSPKRPLLSPPRRPTSPPRRHFSPQGRIPAPIFCLRDSPGRRQFSPPAQRPRPHLPVQRPGSPFRLDLSPPRRFNSPPRRPGSPGLRPAPDSFRRQPSPFRPPSITPPRGQSSPITGTFIPQRRQGPSPTRGMPMSRPTQEMMPPNRQPMPQGRQERMSPPRRAPSPQRIMMNKRQTSPTRLGDEWDIPTRGAVEQNSWHLRMQDNAWRTERQAGGNPTSKGTWTSASSGDRFNKNPIQDKWAGGPGNSWNSNTMQGPSKGPGGSKWTQPNQNNRWQSKGDGGNWNPRGHDNRGDRDNQWKDNNQQRGQGRWESNDPGHKEDWNDLPEDARDPWGDDGNMGLKERWAKADLREGGKGGEGLKERWAKSDLRDEEGKCGGSYVWIDGERDSRPKSKDNWPAKSQLFAAKPQWQNTNNQTTRQGRWFMQNDAGKKEPAGNSWQGGTNTSSWKPQQPNFQPRFSFSTTQFK